MTIGLPPAASCSQSLAPVFGSSATIALYGVLKTSLFSTRMGVASNAALLLSGVSGWSAPLWYVAELRHVRPVDLIVRRVACAAGVAAEPRPVGIGRR